MKLQFLIYLVACSILTTVMAEYASHLRELGDSRSDLFYWLTLAVFCMGALLTLRRAFIDGVIDNN